MSALVRLEGGLEVQGKKVVAVLTMGEREGAPAELGHDGAGFVSSSDILKELGTDDMDIVPPRRLGAPPV